MSSPPRSRRAKHERRRLDALGSHERLLSQVGVWPVAGVDEAGMGPLAGPVVAAAVIVPCDDLIDDVNDSKLLTRLARERLDAEVRKRAQAIGIGVVDVGEIDRINIYQAGLKAMRLAVERLSVAARHVFVDAREIPELGIPQTSFMKGDQLVYSIAAASIVAKVYRDRLMLDLASRYPGYGFDVHAGYATSQHRAALRRLGPCPAHRRSFTLL